MTDYLADSDLETQDLSDDYDPTEDLSSTDLPSFDIGLSPTGDAGAAFRTQNDPSAPFQRSNYIERKGAVDIRCTCLDVIHGLFSASSATPATLLILQFRFDARKRARRFESVDISLEFRSMTPGERGPEVYAIAPDDRMSLVPTTQHEERKRDASLTLGGAAPVGGVSATGKVGWEKTVKRDTSDQTTVTGSIDLKGRNWGPSNCASWTLLENKTTKTGVPAAMRTAVLLKRKDESLFQCVVSIDARVDFKSTVERVFGGKGREPKDDPVLFDPELDPTNNLREYDVKELEAFDLERVCDVTFATALDGAMKKKSQKGGEIS
jgi:hypothetical protein